MSKIGFIPHQLQMSDPNVYIEKHNTKLKTLIDTAGKWLDQYSYIGNSKDLCNAAYDMFSFESIPYQVPQIDQQGQSLHLDYITKEIEKKEQFLDQFLGVTKRAFEGMPIENLEAMLELQTMPFRKEIDELKQHLTNHLNEEGG